MKITYQNLRPGLKDAYKYHLKLSLPGNPENDELSDYIDQIKELDGFIIGLKSEFSIISLVTLPPDFEEAIYGKRSIKYSYIDEVTNIKESKFALPEAIRKLTMNPPEVGMGGYSPIPVSDAHGKAYNLSPFENFTNSKLDEPISALDFRKALSENPIALQRVSVQQVIADPF